MNKLRQSFRRKKDVYVPESSRPHQWQTDEEAVRSGKCSFAVKVTPSTLPRTETLLHTQNPTESHRRSAALTLLWQTSEKLLHAAFLPKGTAVINHKHSECVSTALI